MAHRGLFSCKVVEAPPAKTKKSAPAVAVAGTPPSHLPREQPPPPAELPKPKKLKKSKWGTPREQYVRLCNFAMLARYGYYCHPGEAEAVSIMSDEVYDRLEKAIFKIENDNREIIYRHSPTVKPGSDRPGDYPFSVQTIWELHKEDRDSWVMFERAALSAMEETLAAFNLSDLSNQKNLEKDA